MDQCKDGAGGHGGTVRMPARRMGKDPAVAVDNVDRVVNDAVADDLVEIAAILSTRRGERFRARAFRTAGRMVAALPVAVDRLGEEELRALDGVGDAVARAIRSHLSDGVSGYLARLREEEPDGFGQLVQVMGVSTKLARELSSRGVVDRVGLAALVAGGEILDVPGVRERTAEVIADGLGRIDHRGAGLPVLRQARLEADRWAVALGGLPGVARAVVAGQVRRGVQQPSALELLAVCTDPIAQVAVAVCEHDDCIRTLADTGDRVDLLTSAGRHLVVHLTDERSAGSALVVATGSEAHVRVLRERGMDDTAPDEPTAYALAGATPVPPPLREVDGPPVPDRLVTLADVVGDGHVHTEWSGDGHDSIDVLATAAVARGYEWIALTDHAENLTMNGLTREALRRRDAAIDAARERHPDVRLLKGLELNIGLDGGLDYDEETLLGQDWCVASVHSVFQRPEPVQTDRILAAVAHPAVHAIGHPVGRLLGMRPGYRIDIHTIAEAAAETGTALEVNGSPRRLDLDAEMVAIAVAAGATLVLDSDAHRARELDYVVEAVLTAQRGGAPLHLIRNARPA